LKRWREHERTGRPLGDEEFLGQLERTLGRVLQRQKRGRKRWDGKKVGMVSPELGKVKIQDLTPKTKDNSRWAGTPSVTRGHIANVRRHSDFMTLMASVHAGECGSVRRGFSTT